MPYVTWKIWENIRPPECLKGLLTVINKEPDQTAFSAFGRPYSSFVQTFTREALANGRIRRIILGRNTSFIARDPNGQTPSGGNTVDMGRSNGCFDVRVCFDVLGLRRCSPFVVDMGR